MISSLIFVANMVLLGIPSAILFIPWCWMSPVTSCRSTRPPASCSLPSCRLAGVRFRVQGLDNILKDRSCIFMSNHVSNLDPTRSHFPSFPTALQPSWRALSRCSCPSSAQASARKNSSPSIAPATAQTRRGGVARSASSVLAKGSSHHYLCRRHALARWAHAALPEKARFFLAMAAGAPPSPISIHGTEKLLRKGSFRMSRRQCQRHLFHPPIDPAAFSTRDSTLMQAVRAAVASGLPEWMRT